MNSLSKITHLTIIQQDSCHPCHQQIFFQAFLSSWHAKLLCEERLLKVSNTRTLKINHTKVQEAMCSALLSGHQRTDVGCCCYVKAASVVLAAAVAIAVCNDGSAELRSRSESYERYPLFARRKAVQTLARVSSSQPKRVLFLLCSWNIRHVSQVSYFWIST